MKINLCFLVPFLIPFFWSCSLDKEIEVKLPPFDKQLVVEAYLEQDKPFKVVVSESDPYFDTLRFPFVNNATVVLESASSKDTIPFFPSLDLESRKFYNYVRENHSLTESSGVMTLSIRDPAGRNLTGSTRFLPLPDVDSIEVRVAPDNDSLTGVVVWINDRVGETNYYRVIMNLDSITGPPSLEFTFTDNGVDGRRFPIGTSFRFEKGKNLIIRLYHIEQQYYNYLRAMEAASRANGNPFAQPATVKSPMSGGGFGIFTTLNMRSFQIRL